jgi:sulfate adenylyltransferase
MARVVGSIAPHGGQLVNRVLRGSLREAALERAESFPRVQLTRMAASDLEMIAVGAFSPLTGFMTQDDYDSVIDTMRLSSGLPWTIPVTLPVDDKVAANLQEGQEIALVAGEHLMGIMTIAEKYRADKEREAQEVYRTTEEAHPGVARLHRHGDWLLGGEVFLLNGPQEVEFPELRHEPAQTRRMFASRGWRRTVAFQTRNPIHRAHEYIQKTALEIVDGLFLHPLVGETKADDIPADVRIESYQAILRDYYPADRVLLGVFPAAMRYAGPREAIFHAIARKNYGCTHFIVGRDHAGVGNYYGTYDAHHIFEEFEPDELGITPLFFDYTFFCRKCGAVVSAKTCPHSKDDWVYLSGTQVREMLEKGEMLPEEFTRPEVSKVLIEGIQSRKEQG